MPLSAICEIRRMDCSAVITQHRFQARLNQTTECTTDRNVTTQTTTTDRPLVDWDIGRISFALMVKGFRQWQRGEVPPRPLGVVRHEVARQVATFAVPALVLLVGGLVGGVDGLLMALMPALFAGWLNDRWLQSSIARQRAAEEVVDLGGRAKPGTFFAALDEETKGRYALVRELAYRLEVPMQAVTPKLVEDFAQRYMAQSKKLVATYVAQEDAKEAERREQQLAREAHEWEVAYRKRQRKIAAVAAATGLATDEVTEEVVARHERQQRADEAEAFAIAHPELWDLDLGVNVASGLPMISGTPYDAGGNIYGTTSAFD